MEKFNLKKLSGLEVRKQYRIKVTKRFTALENCCDSEAINRSWKHFKENIKISAKESLGLHKGKQAKCSCYSIQTKVS